MSLSTEAQLSDIESRFKTEYSGKDGLDATQVQLFGQLYSEYADGADVIEGIILPNSDTTDAYRFPKGQAISHPLEAKVRECSINPGLHDHLVLMRILPSTSSKTELNDAFFRANEAKISAAVPQFTVSPARLDMRDAKNHDIRFWTPEMGSKGWVGILKKRDANGRDEDSTYYIGVKAGVELAINDMISDFADAGDPKDVTFKHFLSNDMDFAYARGLGKRNALRAAFRVAEAIGVRIHNQTDHKAHYRGQIAKATMALPLEGDFIQPLSSMEIVETSPNKEVALNMSMGVNPKKVREECLIMVDPYAGLVGINMDPKHGGRVGTSFETKVVPVCTGRAVAPKDVSTKARAIKNRMKGVTWEEKVEGEINDRIAPDAYRPFDENFEALIEKAGWNKRWGMERYTPVVMKLANRKLVRPN